jgi:hypothetical protein
MNLEGVGWEEVEVVGIGLCFDIGCGTYGLCNQSVVRFSVVL